MISRTDFNQSLDDDKHSLKTTSDTLIMLWKMAVSHGLLGNLAPKIRIIFIVKNTLMYPNFIHISSF